MHRVTTRHHHIRVDIISNHEVRTVDPIYIDCYGFQFYIGAGFKTDGASLPRIFWTIYQPFELDTLRGAIVHDYIYRTHKKSIKRFWADMIFLAIMKESGASFFKRWIFFIMVRLFGWIPRDLFPYLKKIWYDYKHNF